MLKSKKFLIGLVVVIGVIAVGLIGYGLGLFDFAASDNLEEELHLVAQHFISVTTPITPDDVKFPDEPVGIMERNGVYVVHTYVEVEDEQGIVSRLDFVLEIEDKEKVDLPPNGLPTYEGWRLGRLDIMN